MRELLLTFLTGSLVMSGIAVVYLLAEKHCLKGYRAKIKYYAWLVVLIGMLIPFRPQIIQPMISLNLSKEEKASSHTPSLQKAAEMKENQSAAQANQNQNKTNHLVNTATSDQVKEALPEETVYSGQIVEETQSAGDFPVSGEGILLGIWSLGAIGVLLYQMFRHLRVVRVTKRWSSIPKEEGILQCYQLACEKRGVKRQIPLYLCECITTPVLFGIWRPRILLPASHYTPEELQLILDHELVHYIRRDLWYKLLLLAGGVIQWFNPIYYLMKE